jgi:hypothetical protein
LSRFDARASLGCDDLKKICVAKDAMQAELKSIVSANREFKGNYHSKILINESNEFIANHSNGIDFLVCSAEYHYFYQALYHGINSHFLPSEKKEDQKWRVKNNSKYSFSKNGADMLVKMIIDLK